jgi:hypothetical protein
MRRRHCVPPCEACLPGHADGDSLSEPASSRGYKPDETSFVSLTNEDALAGRWDFDAFDCGQDPYNEWLSRHAVEQVRARTAGVHLLVSDRDQDRDRILGYFAVSLTVVQRDEIPRRLQPGGAAPASANYLLAKLGLQVELHGLAIAEGSDVTWGKILLQEALQVCVQASAKLGGRLVVVDADNSALVKHYEGFGFRAMRDADGNLLSLRLVMKTSTAASGLSMT